MATKKNTSEPVEPTRPGSEAGGMPTPEPPAKVEDGPDAKLAAEAQQPSVKEAHAAAERHKAHRAKTDSEAAKAARELLSKDGGDPARRPRPAAQHARPLPRVPRRGPGRAAAAGHAVAGAAAAGRRRRRRRRPGRQGGRGRRRERRRVHGAPGDEREGQADRPQYVVVATSDGQKKYAAL
jgi:hypothetical protein